MCGLASVLSAFRRTFRSSLATSRCSFLRCCRVGLEAFRFLLNRHILKKYQLCVLAIDCGNALAAERHGYKAHLEA
jgi:hypothetical protein